MSEREIFFLVMASCLLILGCYWLAACMSDDGRKRRDR